MPSESDAHKIARLEQEVVELRLALTPFAEAGRHVYPDLRYDLPFMGYHLKRAHDTFVKTAPPFTDLGKGI